MEKYLAVEEMVELFNSFTTDKDLTIGGFLWVCPSSLGGRKVITRDSENWGLPTPSVEHYFTPWGENLRDFTVPNGDFCSWGYFQENILEVEFRSASSGSTLRWTRMSDQIGVLEYTPGCDPSYEGSYKKAFKEAEGIKPLI